jgi:mono/diheme cytochrome c family protein
MIKRIAIPLVVLLGLLAAGGVALRAQHAWAQLKSRFDAYDANKDGVLTADEVPPALFASLDTDGNGSVAPMEAGAAVRKMRGAQQADSSEEAAGPLAERLFKTVDRNNDGQITREESRGAEWFDRLDRDKDDRVTLPETLAVADQIKAMVQKNPTVVGPTSEAAPAKPVATGPLILKPGDLGVGRQVPDVSFTALDGTQHQLSSLAQRGKGIVIACSSTTCPVSKRYTPSLARHAAELEKQGLTVLFLNPLATDKKVDIEADIRNHSLISPYVHGKDSPLVAVLQPSTSTEVFLLDAQRTLVYRGALDDQYGVHYNLDAPRQRFLMDAVAAHLEGRLPLVAATEAPGCELDEPAAAAIAATDGLTYHGDISRILRQNCVECHHEGGLAPFALDDPAEVADRAKVIRRVIEDGTMPPWFAKPAPEGEATPWANERSLSKKDRTDLLAWLSTKDRPLGSPADAPAPLKHDVAGWKHGRPDIEISFAKPQQVKAEGKMPYVNVTVPTGFAQETWVRGYEVMPGAREVVHHVLVFALDPASKGRVKEHDSFFAAYVPGCSSVLYPAGFAKRVPPGATLRFQMHYTPNGTAVEDTTRIGLYLSKEPPTHEVHVGSVSNTRLSIPPGAAAHEVIAQRTIPADLTLMAFMPHMHVRGKAFRYELVQASGTKVLLDVPRYDFNWQLQYRLKEPLMLSRGTVIRGIAHYDNSADNKANPDPTKTVRWGAQTEDEMMIGYMEYYVPVAKSTTALAE